MSDAEGDADLNEERRRSDEARRERAEARRARGVTVEVLYGFPEDVPYFTTTIAERIAMTAQLTRAAWLASGRALPTLPRSAWPGEIFRIEDERDRRAP
jgi:hypothetical protein